MRITLIVFDGVSELGRVAIEGVTVAARDQVILHAHGGIDRMAEQAHILPGQRVARRESQEPHTEIEWSLRAMINVVGVLAAHTPE